MDDAGIEPTNEEKFNPSKIYESFYDILKYSNYKRKYHCDSLFWYILDIFFIIYY